MCLSCTRERTCFHPALPGAAAQSETAAHHHLPETPLEQARQMHCRLSRKLPLLRHRGLSYAIRMKPTEGHAQSGTASTIVAFDEVMDSDAFHFAA